MINVLSFRLFPWYSSGIFVLIMIVLTLIYIIVSNGVSPLIITLFSSGTTLLIPYNNNNNYNGPLVVLNIKPDAYNLDDYNFNIYSLFI